MKIPAKFVAPGDELPHLTQGFAQRDVGDDVLRELLGELEEGLHLFDRVVADLRRLDQVQPVVLQLQMVRIKDEIRSIRRDSFSSKESRLFCSAARLNMQ